jgi:hypothetical protein
VVHLECDPAVMGDRLNRGKGVYDNINFDAQNSRNEMVAYKRVLADMKHTKSLPDFKLLSINTDIGMEELRSKVYKFLEL